MIAWIWDISLGFDKPQWLWLALLVPVLVVLSLRSLAGLDPVRRVLSLILRSAVILVLAASLAEVVTVRKNDDLTVMFLMDRSDSVKGKLEQQEGYIREVCQDTPADDRIGVIDFARHAFPEQMPMSGYHLNMGRLPDIANKDRTDIAGAIRLAKAMFPHDAAKRIVILSDGNDNMGDLVEAARTARADGVAIDVVPLHYEHRNEIYFDRLIAPSQAEKGAQVPLRMVLHSQRRASGTIDLYHNGVKVELPPGMNRVELQPGPNPFVFKQIVDSSGTHRFDARFTPDSPEQDAIVENNRANTFSYVSGRGKVLLVTANEQHDIRLAEALAAENIDVEMKDVSEIQDELPHESLYACIILSNVPANSFTDEYQESLASYVRRGGGGLIMTGGDEGFGAGGWIGSPVEDIMPVRFEIKHKRIIPRGALVLVMHSCEIPRGNFWGKEVAKKSVDTISSRDYIGVLAYTWSPSGENWVVPLQLATNKAAVKSRIDQMQIGDMPDFDATMNMALKGLASLDASQKHIIMVSDGDPQPPRRSILKGMKEAKITCSTIGIGFGSHVMQQPLKDIAKATGGRYYPCRNPRRLPQIFVKESKIVRRPLIIDEPFQPQVMFRDSDVLPGVFTTDDVPELGGLVLTSAKSDSRVQVPLIRATKDGNDPVLAHWQEGLGKTVAFTSGYWPRWGKHWTRWARFSKLWAQIVRWSMRQEAPANFETFVRIEGDTGRVSIDALDEDGNYLDRLVLDANVVAPDLTGRPLTFVQTGPGHYEATFPVEQTGQYVSNVRVLQQGGGGALESVGQINAGAAVPFSPEFRELRTNEALLRQVAEITGGRWLTGDPEQDDIFSHDLPPTVSRRPAWDWTLAWLVLPLFLLDVAVRRLASWLAFSICVEAVVIVFLLWGMDLIHGSVLGVLGVLVLAELIGWSIRFRSIRPAIEGLTHSVTALSQTGDRSSVALEQLKGTRDRVRDEQTKDGGASCAEPAPDAGARFDVGDQQAKQPAGDLHEQLGGAKGEPRYVEKRRKPAGDSKEDQEADVTSRLLKAKRRARKDIDQEE